MNASIADAKSNRQSIAHSVSGTTHYTSNALNQYTLVGSDILLYDGNGNLVTQGLGANYSYDAQNRLLGATKGTSTMSVTYDGRNRPVSRTLNGTTTYFVYDGWRLIAEYSSAGTLLTRYVHGSMMDEILAKTDANGTVYYHHDGLSSTVALSNAEGNVVESYSYDVFGKVTIFDAAFNPLPASLQNNRFLFTGREWLAEVGLYDYRNRIYSPELGRFLQTDPIRFAAGDVNLYRYVSNNPAKWIDPYGLKDWGWPANGSVKNESDKCVCVLVNGDYEELGSGESTPDSPFNSKDVDGVWSNGNFYPVAGGQNLEIGPDGKPKDGTKPWDPNKPSDPKKNPSPSNRGSKSGDKYPGRE